MSALKPIRCYVSTAGNNKIAEWHGDLSAQERADADNFIEIMRKLKRWSLPYYRPALTGFPGLGELRWQSENKQHRLIGFFQGETWYAVMGCTHKQRVYKPPDALNTASKRKKQIERQEVNTVDYDL